MARPPLKAETQSKAEALSALEQNSTPSQTQRRDQRAPSVNVMFKLRIQVDIVARIFILLPAPSSSRDGANRHCTKSNVSVVVALEQEPKARISNRAHIRVCGWSRVEYYASWPRSASVCRTVHREIATRPSIRRVAEKQAATVHASDH